MRFAIVALSLITTCMLAGCSSEDDAAAEVSESAKGRRLCRNGVIDPGEQCDAANLAGQNCSSLTNGVLCQGVLKCTKKCVFDTSACFSACCGAQGMGGLPCG